MPPNVATSGGKFPTIIRILSSFILAASIVYLDSRYFNTWPNHPTNHFLGRYEHHTIGLLAVGSFILLTLFLYNFSIIMYAKCYFRNSKQKNQAYVPPPEKSITQTKNYILHTSSALRVQPPELIIGGSILQVNASAARHRGRPVILATKGIFRIPLKQRARILAHELSHFANSDVSALHFNNAFRKSMIVVLAAAYFNYIIGVIPHTPGRNEFYYFILTTTFFLIKIAALYTLFFLDYMSVSRSRERGADLTSGLLTRVRPPLSFQNKKGKFWYTRDFLLPHPRYRNNSLGHIRSLYLSGSPLSSVLFSLKITTSFSLTAAVIQFSSPRRQAESYGFITNSYDVPDPDIYLDMFNGWMILMSTTSMIIYITAVLDPFRIKKLRPLPLRATTTILGVFSGLVIGDNLAQIIMADEGFMRFFRRVCYGRTDEVVAPFFSEIGRLYLYENAKISLEVMAVSLCIWVTLRALSQRLSPKTSIIVVIVAAYVLTTSLGAIAFWDSL